MTCRRQFESGISSILVGGSGIGCPGSENVLWTLMDPRSLEFMMVVVMVVMVMVVMVMVVMVMVVMVESLREIDQLTRDDLELREDQGDGGVPSIYSKNAAHILSSK